MPTHTVRTIVGLLLIALCHARAAQAQPPAGVVHAFDGADGADPRGGLTEGRDGLLYGTTHGPGPGTIFRVGADGSSFQTLYVFGSGGSADGTVPSRGRLVEVEPGRFVGTTSEGGAHGYGTLYRLDVRGATPVVTVLRSFDEWTRHPDSGVVLGSNGLLYGTTLGDFVNNHGTVYRVERDGSTFTVLHTFSVLDGARPSGGVIEASNGWLYGTTEYGGAGGGGTVFRIGLDGTGFERLVELEGHPVAGLTEAPGPGGAPVLYGVETGGGTAAPLGSIFRLGLDGLGFQRVGLFTGTDRDGAAPRSPLLLGRDGQLYGTASTGWHGCETVNCGTVFRVLPTGEPYAIHLFTIANGGTPDGALVLARDGLYGTASMGGTPASGTGTGQGVVWTVRNPGTVPLVFTGPSSAFEGGGVSYFLRLDNTTTSHLPGPFTVDVSPSAGLQLAVQPSAAGWTCTVGASGPACVWPSDLPPGAVTDTVVLSFDVAPPFATACGIGASPCVIADARLRSRGVAITLAAPVTTASNAPPFAADDAAFAVSTLATTVNVLDNDADPDGDPLSLVEIVEPPVAGNVTFTADGSVTYTAFGALTRPDTFRYRVSDGRGATATAIVTVTPRIPTLSTSKTRVDIGRVAVGRIAAGRTTVFSDDLISGPVRFEHVSPQELQAALAGTGYDPADAVSDPDAFRTQYGWVAYSHGAMLIMYYRPITVGRVSVARAVLTSDMPGLESVTRSLIIIGAAAEPATAPLRATDDTATTQSGTPVVIDVMANDGGESGGARPLYVSMSGACPSIDFFADICIVQGPALGGSITAPPSIRGPQYITVSPLPADATGTVKSLYASSELEACFDEPGAGGCLLEGNMYFATVTVTVVPREQADLGVTVTATPGAVSLGDAVTVTVTVTNTGPDAARAATFTGLGLLGLHHTIERVTPSQGTCLPSTAGSPVACALGDLAAGQSATVEVVARATAQIFDGVTDPQVSVLLSASVASDTDDPDPANNSRFTSYVVRRPQADLGVTVTATPGSLVLGDAVTVTVTVTNAGPDPARATTFTGLGLLSINHTFERVTPSQGSCPPPTTGAGLACALGDLAAGQSATVEVVARATAQIFGGVTDPQVSVLLTASVASASHDAALANNSAFTSYVVRRPQADLAVTLVSSAASVEVGTPITFTATVRNLGPDPATGVALTGFAGISTFGSPTLTTSAGVCTPLVPGADATCTIGALAAGASATVALTLTPPASLFAATSATSLPFAAAATVTTAAFDGVPGNNAGSMPVTVTRAGPRPDLRIASAGFFTTGPGGGTPLTTARVGDIVELRVRVENVGDAYSGAVSFAVAIPGLQLMTQIPAACQPGQVTWCGLPDVIPGQSRDARFTFYVSGAALPAGQPSAAVTGTVTAQSSTTGFGGWSRREEINLANNTAQASLTVVDGPRPDLRIVSARFFTAGPGAPAPVTTARVGDRVELRLMVENIGDGWSGTITPSATIPGLTPAVPCAVIQVLCSSPDLPPGGSREIRFQLVVGAAALPAGQSTVLLSGTATVTSATRGLLSVRRSAEINLANNSTGISLTVIDRARPDLRISDAGFFAAGASTPATTARIGDVLELRLTVENVGDAWSGAVDVSTVAPGLSVLGRVPSCPPGQATCALADIAPGGSREVRFTVRVEAGALPLGQSSAPLTATATVRSSTRSTQVWSRAEEVNLANNSVQATLTIMPALSVFP
jgi:uncharacterized repeat protein (TIGR01451 family)